MLFYIYIDGARVIVFRNGGLKSVYTGKIYGTLCQLCENNWNVCRQTLCCSPHSLSWFPLIVNICYVLGTK